MINTLQHVKSLCYLFSALSSSMCVRMLSVTAVTPLGGNVTSVGVRRQEPNLPWHECRVHKADAPYAPDIHATADSVKFA